MLNRETISSRLAHIRDSLSLLRPILEMDSQEYAQNPDHFLKAERLMEIVAQAMIDICAHVVSAMGLPKAEDYRQLADVLANHKVVSERLRRRLQAIFALRNILAHQYLVVDRARFHQEAKAGIADIEGFCAEIARLVP